MPYTDPQRRKVNARKWYALNRVRVLKSRKGYKSDPRQRHNSHLRRTYGITIDTYEAMLMGQSGKCAICQREPKTNRRLHVDHNHVTGVVRGLLCYGCNSALGHLEKNITIFLEYLKV